jgi:hypothetical protein
MSYTINWHIPNRVAIVQIEETLTLEDGYAQNSYMMPLLNEADQPIHMIIDLTLTRKFPMRLDENVWAGTQYMRHPMMGWLMIINRGSNPLLHMLMSVVGKTTGVKVRFVDSFDEALTSLQKLDLTLKAA